MLEVAADNGFHFDTAQMPLNVLDAHFRSFSHKVVPELVKRKIGVLCMKSLASGAVMETQAVTAAEARHYSMNLPVSVVICGIDSMERLDEAMDQVKTFHMLSQDELDAILAKTAKVAAKGKYEQFKTTSHFDSTAHAPQWLG
jgi:aryl-alcohol dehydrogenase-like predicted oxidoreductase